MEFQGTQRRCQTCHCHKGSTRSIPIRQIRSEDEIVTYDSCNAEMTKNRDHANFLCLHCKVLLKQVNSFLKNVEDLNKKEWCGICDHCREMKSTNQCKRCSYFVSQSRKGKEKCQDTQKWKDMLNKMKIFLETLTINKRCVNSCDIAFDSEDLAKKFDLMQIPSATQTVIKESSDLDMLKYKNTWERLDNLKIESPKTSEIFSARKTMDLTPVQSKEQDTCICQKLAEISKHLSLDTITEEKLSAISIIPKENVMYSKKIDDVNVTKRPPLKGPKTIKKSVKETGTIKKTEKKSGKVKTKASSELFIKKILKERKNLNRSRANLRISKDQKILERFLRTEIDELPPLPVKIHEEKTEEESGSVVYCKELNFLEPKEVIQKNKILTQEQNNKQTKHQNIVHREPLFFEVDYDFTHKTVNIADNNVEKKIEHRKSSEPPKAKAPAKYRLSNRKYIDDGFTVLPTFKMRRRIKLYKMITPLSKFDWLEKYKDRKNMYYSSGEKLSEISDGQIRWYYKDGGEALEFWNIKENNTSDEFIIYDSIDLRKKSGHPDINLMLARFDKMGHGVVYDRKGCVRLKYNQYEGIILDDNVGPTARWKWNNLNEPPEIQHIFEDCYDTFDNCLNNQTNEIVQNEISSNIIDKEMYAIELDNYVKETLNMHVPYKQYQIKFKVLRINEHFTLKIIEQSKIFLLFRDGGINFKLNLGMRLISNQIIDVKTVDFREVVTPYDNI